MARGWRAGYIARPVLSPSRPRPDMPQQDGHSSAGSKTATTLIDQLKAGNEASWSYFLFAYRPLIESWAVQAGADPSDATDIAQDVASNVVRGIQKFDKRGQTGSFRKWLKVITQRRAIDFLRKRGRTLQADGGTDANDKLQQLPDPTTDDLTHSVAVDERIVLVRQAMAYFKSKVKPQTYEAFQRVVIEGQDPQQVAKDLKVNIAVVYKSSSRMLARLRKVLSDEITLPD